MRMKRYLMHFLQEAKKSVLLVGLLLSVVLSAQAQTLVWEENFEGSTINPETWTFDFGDGCERGICGWGNQELEYYTSRPENARIENGNLLIEARQENFGGKPFTSARLKTFGRVHFKYGTLEARIKVPNLANGLWPAFWMLGTTGNWPASGEIDIMEMGNGKAIQDGVINRRVGAAVHWENNNSQADYGADYDSPIDLAGTGDYHIYKMSWDSQFIRVYVDNIEYFTINIAGAAASDLEEFHNFQYILLNLAIGGNYTGIPTPEGVTAPLPSQMLIDYIKLYQNTGDELYLGKNNAIAGEYGVYTESPAIPNRLTYGQDANLYIWNNLANIPGAVAFEGTEVLALRAAANNWFGFGVETQPKNLLNFANGSLKFHMKTSYTGQFKVGLKSGHGESWINFAPGVSQYGLVRDGQWHEVTIALSTFNNPNMGMHIDLGSLNQMFMFAGDPARPNADFYIDNIYYSGGIATNPAPTVSITSPVNDALIATPANITIDATAADANGSITKVDFYNGAVLLESDDTSPYSYTWTELPVGVYTLIAKATDNEGVVTTSQPVTIFVAAPNNTAPSISINSPTASSSFTKPATINIVTDATDTDGTIYKVEFFNGNTLLGTDFTSPFGFTWSNVDAGTYSITAKATDNGKLTATSTAVSVIVKDNVVSGGDYGIYTENPAITNKLIYGQDANIYYWNNIVNIAGATPFEGAEVLALRAAAGNWFGFGVANDVKNLAYFTGGSLRFNFKTSFAGFFKVGIKSLTGESWVEFGAGVEKHGLKRDGEWHEVSIPLSAFANLNLSAVDQSFMFAGDAPSTTADFYIDNIYYTKQTPSVGPNLALNKPVTVSSTENAGTPGSNAVDGNLSTRWASAFSDPQWLAVDLGKVYSINEVKITWETALAKDYQVQTSTDGTVWTTIKTISDNATLVNSHSGLNAAARYVRIYGTARALPYGYSIFELEVYGEASEAYCSTAANGDYSWKAVTAGENVTFTFHPLGETAGGNLAIIYIREGSAPNYPGYTMVKNASGDFTFSKAIPTGTETSIYFTYQVGANGPERNTAASPHSYTVGTVCDGVTNMAPSVSLTSPTNNSVFTSLANITINATANDSDGTIAKVEFYNGETLLGEDATFPYSFDWTNVVGGTYSLTAKATDNGGATKTSSIVTVSVEGTSTTGEYCSTAANGDYSWKAVTAGENVTFTFHPLGATAGGNLAIIYIREGNAPNYPGYMMAKNGSGDFTFSKVIPTGTVTSIYFTYQVGAGGPENNTSTSPHSYIVGTNCIPVANTAPAVSITSPANNAAFMIFNNINITANATDTDGTIAKVEFYNGMTLLGEDATAPYTFNWQKVAAGTYSITAKAIDNGGASTVSVPVTIQVIDARCGKKLDKVLVCHKGKELCVSVAELAMHLAHGDKLGGCTSGQNPTARIASFEEQVEETGLTVYPNPSRDKARIDFSMKTDGAYSLGMYDLKGTLVREITTGHTQTGNVISFELIIANYAQGVYIIKLITDTSVSVKRLMVQ